MPSDLTDAVAEAAADAPPAETAARDRSLVLDLALHPDDAARLPRVTDLARLRAGRARTTPVQIVWHDTPDGALAADGLALAEYRTGRQQNWQVERLRGTRHEPWLPGTPAPVIERAALPADFTHSLPGPLLPVAAFAGVARSLPLSAEAGSLSVSLLEGVLRAVTDERPLCRMTVSGPGEAALALAQSLSQHVRLSVPATSLAAQACATAGRAVAPVALGAPHLPTGLSVGNALAALVAHLLAVILHWSPRAAAGTAPEPVHQMRVALRRLRSALALFRRAVDGPALAQVAQDLRDLQRVLGPARDWDVFTGGTGRAIAEAMPDDRPVARLLMAAERRRVECYAALRDYLEAPGFRRMGIRLAGLAVMRPWDTGEDVAADPVAAEKQAAALAAPLAEFAARALTRRLDRMAEAGSDLAALTLPELHKLRIQGKRLRYAMEFFAPLYPPRDTRRFLRRVSILQECLGHLNDGGVAASLMAELGSGAGERGYATGVVRGFVAARQHGTRAEVDQSWRKFWRLEPFWE